MMRPGASARPRPAGLEHRLRPSLRATVLALASRTALVVLMIAAGAIASLPLWSVDGEAAGAVASHGQDRRDVSDVRSEDDSWGEGRAMTTSELLAGVDRETRGVGARIVELELVPAVGARADVRMRIDTPGGDAASVARVVGALERARLDGPSVRTVTPVASGARLDVTAVIERATSQLMGSGAEHGDTIGTELTVALTALVQRAGAELVRLEVRDVAGPEQERTVQLAARAGAQQLVTMLDALEREHTAPMRFAMWRVVSLGDDLELTATFGRRTPTPLAVGMAVTP
jgi:hypothetical protein